MAFQLLHNYMGSIIILVINLKLNKRKKKKANDESKQKKHFADNGFNNVIQLASRRKEL